MLLSNNYQEFFNFMSQEHDLTLTLSEMDEIVQEAAKLKKVIDDKNAAHVKQYTDALEVIYEPSIHNDSVVLAAKSFVDAYEEGYRQAMKNGYR